ncbi:circularly permuted type 2 ATP-grasp protein [Jiulongibacter sp. NS-SX5]|uniref:circularly permuted type 2 ATP-grasp protein n=1 Tax=Jiulongibacter sp. NS-SX5 TaxID=3463854 RepID=UPI004058209F
MITPYIPDKKAYDEVFNSEGKIRPHYHAILEHFVKYTPEKFRGLIDDVKLILNNEGVTFAVYSDTMKATERIFPFDIIPRLITRSKWDKLEKGVLQRNEAINLFLHDLYHDQETIKAGIVPEKMITSSVHYLDKMKGFTPPGGVYNHISGTDIIRHNDGEFYVLEDNIRSPSGVSYVISNRRTLKKTFPGLFASYKTARVDNYSSDLLDMLQSVAPDPLEADPKCVVLTPGIYNSAYYEHTWLAQSMGIRLVEGRDLSVKNDCVYMKTINGIEKVDVIYRRIDDAFLDPEAFREDSMLGVPGLFRAYLSGNVTLVNAPGTGVADDKAVYTFMPEIIKFFFGSDVEIGLNNVPTYKCEEDDDFKYVLENLNNLVVKPVDESGGYGISIGNQLTEEELDTLADTLKKARRKYIAQPIMSLSMQPTYIEDTNTVEPRHVDLRTFCLKGGNGYEKVLAGGLTRVALRKGNLIVNSSQGGGSKDTWVIE